MLDVQRGQDLVLDQQHANRGRNATACASLLGRVHRWTTRRGARRQQENGVLHDIFPKIRYAPEAGTGGNGWSRPPRYRPAALPVSGAMSNLPWNSVPW